MIKNRVSDEINVKKVAQLQKTSVKQCDYQTKQRNAWPKIGKQLGLINKEISTLIKIAI